MVQCLGAEYHVLNNNLSPVRGRLQIACVLKGIPVSKECKNSAATGTIAYSYNKYVYKVCKSRSIAKLLNTNVCYP